MRHVAACTAAVAVLALAACSDSSGSSMDGILNPFSGSASTGSASSSLTAADTGFVMEAAQGGVAEVQLGELAQRKASSQAVRDFGRTMVTQHSQANRELTSIASSKGLTAPTAPDPGRKAVSTALESLSGPAFDQQYVQQQLADHEVQLSLFQNEAQRGQDPDLRAFAERYTPVIRQHIDMLRGLSTRVSSL